MSQDKPGHKGETPRVGLTRKEAAERLGVSEKTFKRHEKENPIEGVWTEGNGPSARRMYPVEAIDQLLLEEQEESAADGVAAMMREAARSQAEINRSSAVATDAAVRVLSGLVPFVQEFGVQLKSAVTRADRAEAARLEAWSLLDEVQHLRGEELIADAKKQAAEILSRERTRWMVESFRDAWPGILHRIVPSKTTERSILARALRRMSDELKQRLAALMFELPPEVRTSVGALFDEASQHATTEEEAESEAERN